MCVYMNEIPILNDTSALKLHTNLNLRLDKERSNFQQFTLR